MTLFLQIVLAVSAIFSTGVAAVYAYIAYQKFMNSKDKVWETALKLATSGEPGYAAGRFAEIYDALMFFKEHDCKLNGEKLIQLMQERELETTRDKFRNTHPQENKPPK